MQVLMIRHGATALNEARCYQGTSDPPLSAAGRRQLKPSPQQVSRLYVSPLLRARQTAALIFPGARQIVVDDLREMDFGIFEGRNAEAMANDEAYRSWVNAGCEPAPPKGESRRAFCERTCHAVGALVESALACGAESRDPHNHDGPLVIVAHGGTIMAALERFAHPSQPYFSWHCPLGCGYELEAAPGSWAQNHELKLIGPISFLREIAEPRGKVGQS